jgi:hypothetical protein
MKVLVNGKVFDSEKNPIMVMFTLDELKNFHSSPVSNDIFSSWPSHWKKSKGLKWKDGHQPGIIYGKQPEKDTIDVEFGDEPNQIEFFNSSTSAHGRK